MGKFFSYDGGLFQTINKIVDCVALSVLWLLFSVFTLTIGMGAATTALYYTVNKVIRHDRSHIWREYWGAFKSNFKQSTIVWLLLGVLYYFLITACLFAYSYMASTAFLVFYLVLTGLTTMWALHLFPHMARFENKTKLIMKNCALIAIRHIIKSVALLVVFAVAVILFLMWPVLIIILPTAYMYLATFILEPIFRRYMSDEDWEAEEERNRVYYN